MVATSCPYCDEWVNGNWEKHRKQCPEFDKFRKKLDWDNLFKDVKL
jgi:hypothetical protein